MAKSEIEPKCFLSKKRLKQALMLVGILIITLALSGCEKFVETDVSAETQLQMSYNESKNIISKGSGNSKNDVLLPDNWTMDDLRNLLVINGKTLILPTSLNKIMELDNNFSYEAKYVDEKSPIYNGKQKGFIVDIFYDNEFMFTTAFDTDIDDVRTIVDQNIYYTSWCKNNCQKSNLNVDLSCNLKFGNSFEEIKNIFGEPNKYDFQSSHRSYEFYDDMYICDLTFELDTEEKISWINILFKLNDKTGGSQYE